MKRATIVAVGILVASTLVAACGGPEEEEGTTTEAVTCSPRMSVFPVGEAHNIGYDRTSCGTGTCEVSCPDRNANSDWSAARGHHGVDIFARRRAPLVAVAAGAIVRVGVVSATSGLRVRLRDSCGWEYYYGHLDEAVVREGQRVQAGQLIGYMGNTGTQGVHLHFNVSPDGAYSNDIDPFQLLAQTSPTACGARPPQSSCSGSSSGSFPDVRFFDAQFYLDLHADLRRAFGPNNQAAALQHWIDHGEREGRMASPVFHSAHYLAGYGDLRSAFGSTNHAAAVRHWLEYGICEGRIGSQVFDPRYYLGRYPDLRAAFGSTNYAAALQHYLSYGIREGRRAHPDFDPTYYMQRYADLRNALGATNYRAAIVHWLVYGRREGRAGAP